MEIFQDELRFGEEAVRRIGNGTKRAFCRTVRYGDNGDLFKVERETFEVDRVETMALGYVAEAYWAECGADSRDGFMAEWEKANPTNRGRAWRMGDMVWFHTFDSVEEVKQPLPGQIGLPDDDEVSA